MHSVLSEEQEFINKLSDYTLFKKCKVCNFWIVESYDKSNDSNLCSSCYPAIWGNAKNIQEVRLNQIRETGKLNLL